MAKGKVWIPAITATDSNQNQRSAKHRESWEALTPHSGHSLQSWTWSLWVPSNPEHSVGVILCNSSSHHHCFSTEQPKDSNCLGCILGSIIEIHFFSTVTSPCCILNFPGQGLRTRGLKPSVLQTENLSICSACPRQLHLALQPALCCLSSSDLALHACPLAQPSFQLTHAPSHLPSWSTGNYFNGSQFAHTNWAVLLLHGPPGCLQPHAPTLCHSTSHSWDFSEF